MLYPTIPWFIDTVINEICEVYEQLFFLLRIINYILIHLPMTPNPLNFMSPEPQQNNNILNVFFI